MIEYKLAKQLKDAGFLLKESENQRTQPEKGSYVIDSVQYKIPTLSELIEACGDEFESLERYSGGSRWRCVKWIKHIYKCDDGKSRYGCLWEGQSWGFTPEEAVAKLWLALNK